MLCRYAHILAPPGPLTASIFDANSPWGTLWTHDIAWQRTGTSAVPFDGRITPAKLSAWLRALAAYICFPPVQGFLVTKHHFPAALPAFWRLLEVLAPRVPPHWLESALKPLLDTDAARRSVSAPTVTCAVDKTMQCKVPVEAPEGEWPVTEPSAPVAMFDFAAVGLEMDACAALWAPRLPALLTAAGLAAANVAGVGGEPLLFELPLGCWKGSNALLQPAEETAQAQRLALVLLHPDEVAARDNIASSPDMPSELKARMAAMGVRMHAPQSPVLQDLALKRGATSKGGTRAQLISSAFWAPTASGANAAVRFWVCRDRLQGMLDAKWCAHAAPAGTWQAITRKAVPLTGGSIVGDVAAS